MRIPRVLVLMSAAALLCSCNNTTKSTPYDIDLVNQSPTFIYSLVLNIVNSPYEFANKHIRLSGYYSEEFLPETNTTYHYVIIPDATQCCQQGLEFVYEGTYPSVGDEIIVTGDTEIYKEGELEYYHILASDLEVITNDN